MSSPRKFSLEQIQEVIREYKQASDSSLRTPQDGPAIAFLPQGRHQIRWFVDPEQDVLRHLWLHQAGKARTLCPARLKATPPAETYPPCEICALATTQTDSWKLKAKQLFMIYGLLLESTHPDKYWHPSQSYVIVGPSGMRDAFEQLADSLTDQDAETVANMFDPRVPGCATQVSVHKGSPGSINMEGSPGSMTITLMRDQVVPPIKLEAWFKPLRQCWISPAFSLTDYQRTLAAVNTTRF